uniref:Uncharacterized protein n=1 Tax=Solanum tuberosum TaxID=4113 RepID=M1DSV0_SOLTU
MVKLGIKVKSPFSIAVGFDIKAVKIVVAESFGDLPTAHLCHQVGSSLGLARWKFVRAKETLGGSPSGLGDPHDRFSSLIFARLSPCIAP